MVYSDKNRVRLEGRVVVITGANAGIGKETALELSSRGARVIMLCRSMDKAKAARDEIVAQTHGDVEVLQMDLSSFKSIRACADKLLNKEEKIDILVNNAGVMHCPEWKTEDGFDMQFGTNHLGHFLLTELLRPLLKRAATDNYRPRIVIVSSLMHEYGTFDFDDPNFEKKSYSDWDAYNQSKLANVLHAKELARRVEADGISVYSLHPGKYIIKELSLVKT